MYMYVNIQPAILLVQVRNYLIPDSREVFPLFRNIPAASNYDYWNIPIGYLLQSGATPLLRASQFGHTKVVALLLEHVANVDTQDKVFVMKRDLPLLAHLYIMDCILYILCTSVIVPFNGVANCSSYFRYIILHSRRIVLEVVQRAKGGGGDTEQFCFT